METGDEKLPHVGRGKWAEPGVPKKGWACIDVDDLGEPSMLCEMCESVEIRYVHVMEHPSFSYLLRVGCVCAEHMEEDYVRPAARERQLKSAARRRVSWGKRVWRLSQHGNPYLNTEGYNLTIVKRGSGWSVIVTNRVSEASQTGRKTYSNEEEAKSAALNALIWAKSHLPTPMYPQG